jgi:hypothetical protein
MHLPSLPMTLDPGQGTTQLGFALRGDTIRARWAIRSTHVQWSRDSAAQGSTGADLLWRTLSGITDLQVDAGVTGTLSQPRLVVRSNLDDAIAARLRTMLGEEAAVAERKLRAEVDRQVDPAIAPVRARVTTLQTDVTKRLADQRARLDQAQKDLEARLRELTRIRLP